jgi:hypothetical protein
MPDDVSEEEALRLAMQASVSRRRPVSVGSVARSSASSSSASVPHDDVDAQLALGDVDSCRPDRCLHQLRAVDSNVG